IVKTPPAYRSVPDTANASTPGKVGPIPEPEPTGVQLLPSHLAILVIAVMPANVKLPPAYRVVPDTASAYTPKEVPAKPPASPGPSADQLLPFHSAILVAAIPPAVVKLPPT